MFDRGQRGATLPDVMIGLAIFGVITVAAMSSVLTIARSSAEVSQDIDLRQDVERVASLVVADVAGSVYVAGDLSAGSYENELQLVIDQLTDERLVWALRDGSLVREQHLGGVVRSRTVMIESQATPAFDYLSASGDELDPEVEGGQRIADCATGVRVTIATDRDDDTASAVADAAIRARVPTVSC